ncbi:unnamed protein product, partial [Trichogramma brassicae]
LFCVCDPRVAIRRSSCPGRRRPVVTRLPGRPWRRKRTLWLASNNKYRYVNHQKKDEPRQEPDRPYQPDRKNSNSYVAPERFVREAARARRGRTRDARE